MTVPHTIPVGDGIHTAAMSCWCHPCERAIEDLGGRQCGTIRIHNAFDCRERYERQGIPTGKGWMIVLEDQP